MFIEKPVNLQRKTILFHQKTILLTNNSLKNYHYPQNLCAIISNKTERTNFLVDIQTADSIFRNRDTHKHRQKYFYIFDNCSSLSTQHISRSSISTSPSRSLVARTIRLDRSPARPAEINNAVSSDVRIDK